MIPALDGAARRLSAPERELLRLRYPLGLTWERIARILELSGPEARRLHRKTLERLLEILTAS